MSYYTPSTGYSSKQSKEIIEFEEQEKARLYRKAINAKVLEAYKSNHALLEYLPTATEENARKFWEQVDQSKKPVKRQIMKLIRLRRGSKEYIYYQQELTSTNKECLFTYTKLA